MANTPYPLPRETRESSIDVGDGTAGPYGPSQYRIFDIADVKVFAREQGAPFFDDVTDTVTVTKTEGATYDTFSVTFSGPVGSDIEWFHVARRVAERSVGVTRGGAMNSDQTEKELSKIATTLSELRRDVDRMPQAGPDQPALQFQPLPEGHFYKAADDGKMIDAGLALPLPPGGTPGQYLYKDGPNDGDAGWRSTSPMPGGGDMLASAYDPAGSGTAVAFADGVSRPYPSRRVAEGVIHAALALVLSISAVNGKTLKYRHDPAGTALTTADGRGWSPDGDVHPDHFGENTAPGTTDMTAATAAAMAYAKTVKFLPEQEYVLNQLVTVPGRTLIGSDSKLTLATGATGSLIKIAGGNFTLEGCSIDISATASLGVGNGQPAISNTTGTCENITIRRCSFAGQTTRPYIALAPSEVSHNLLIEDCAFVGRYGAGATDAAFDGGGVRLLYAKLGNRNITIRRNAFSRIVANGVQMRYSGGDVNTYGCFAGLDLSENICFEAAYNLTTGQTWFETISVDSYTCHRNIMIGGGRGLSCGAVRNGSYVGNALSGLYSYGVEMAYSTNVVFSGNTLRSCANFIADNGQSGYTQSNGILIDGNVILGGNNGLAGWNAPNEWNCISQATNDEGYRAWTITNNQFYNLLYGAVPVLIRGSAQTRDIVVSHNTVIQMTAQSRPDFLMIRCGIDVTVKHNVLKRYANITDDTSGAGTFAAIGFSVGEGLDRVDVSDNSLSFVGTDQRGSPGFIGIGTTSAPNTLQRLTVNDNKLSGGFTVPLSLPVTNGDTLCLGNDTRQCSASNALNSAIVYRNMVRQISGTAAPAGQAHVRGDICWNEAASSGGNAGWQCTVSGSPGTWKAFGTLA